MDTIQSPVCQFLERVFPKVLSPTTNQNLTFSAAKILTMNSDPPTYLQVTEVIELLHLKSMVKIYMMALRSEDIINSLSCTYDLLPHKSHAPPPMAPKTTKTVFNLRFTYTNGSTDSDPTSLVEAQFRRTGLCGRIQLKPNMTHAANIRDSGQLPPTSPSP